MPLWAGVGALLASLSLCAFAQDKNARALAAELEQAMAAGRVEQAQKALGAMLALPQVELEVLLETGAKLAERELFEPAGAVFARGVKDYPKNFEVRYNLALADIALQRFDDARAALNGLTELSKDQQLAREYLRGKIHDATGEGALAEKCFTAAFAGAPQQENYALDLGLLYLRQRQYAKAMSPLETGVKYHPDSEYLLLGLGLAQLFGDDPQRAVATCRKILTMQPEFSPARLLLVVAFYMNGENENCVKETAAAIARPGAPPYLYYLHAASLLKLGSKEHAVLLRDLETANRAIPGCSFCYFTLSKVHQEMGDEAAAIADLETLVVRVDPEFSQGWYRLASLYQHAGKQEDGARALAKFRAIRSAQTDRETEYLRKLFLSALGAESPAK